MKLRMAMCMVAAIGLAATTAQGEPSVWAKAANPKAAKKAKAQKKADIALARDFSLRKHPSTTQRSIVLRRTLKRLKKVKAHKSSDPQLRHRLAQVHYRLYDVTGNEKHLVSATKHYAFVSTAPKLPTTQRARVYNSLAICYARLGEHEKEVKAYNHAIALQPDPFSHAILLANQAEGYMARGQIIDAVRGYRVALRATPSVLMIDSGVTTMWGLAVALDRSGDLDAALQLVRRARSYDPGDIRINGSNWFYVPPYDKHWYEALGHWQIARDEVHPIVRREAFRAATKSLRKFMANARPDDPWLAIGEHRLTQCELELEVAVAKADAAKSKKKKKPRKPTFFEPSPRD